MLAVQVKYVIEAILANLGYSLEITLEDKVKNLGNIPTSLNEIDKDFVRVFTLFHDNSASTLGIKDELSAVKSLLSLNLSQEKVNKVVTIFSDIYLDISLEGFMNYYLESPYIKNSLMIAMKNKFGALRLNDTEGVTNYLEQIKKELTSKTKSFLVDDKVNKGAAILTNAIYAYCNDLDLVGSSSMETEKINYAERQTSFQVDSDKKFNLKEILTDIIKASDILFSTSRSERNYDILRYMQDKVVRFKTRKASQRLKSISKDKVGFITELSISKDPSYYTNKGYKDKRLRGNRQLLDLILTHEDKINPDTLWLLSDIVRKFIYNHVKYLNGGDYLLNIQSSIAGYLGSPYNLSAEDYCYETPSFSELHTIYNSYFDTLIKGVIALRSLEQHCKVCEVGIEEIPFLVLESNRLERFTSLSDIFHYFGDLEEDEEELLEKEQPTDIMSTNPISPVAINGLSDGLFLDIDENLDIVDSDVYLQLTEQLYREILMKKGVTADSLDAFNKEGNYNSLEFKNNLEDIELILNKCKILSSIRDLPQTTGDLEINIEGENKITIEMCQRIYQHYKDDEGEFFEADIDTVYRLYVYLGYLRLIYCLCGKNQNKEYVEHTSLHTVKALGNVYDVNTLYLLGTDFKKKTGAVLIKQLKDSINSMKKSIGDEIPIKDIEPDLIKELNKTIVSYCEAYRELYNVLSSDNTYAIFDLSLNYKSSLEKVKFKDFSSFKRVYNLHHLDGDDVIYIWNKMYEVVKCPHDFLVTELEKFEKETTRKYRGNSLGNSVTHKYSKEVEAILSYVKRQKISNDSLLNILNNSGSLTQENTVDTDKTTVHTIPKELSEYIEVDDTGFIRYKGGDYWYHTLVKIHGSSNKLHFYMTYKTGDLYAYVNGGVEVIKGDNFYTCYNTITANRIL